MAEKTRNVFERLQESINKVAEQLHDANDALYVVATETMDLNEKLGNLIAKIDQVLSKSVKVTLDEGTVPAPKEPEENTAVKYAYPSKQAIKKEVTG